MSILMRLSVVVPFLVLFGCAGQSARQEDASFIGEAQSRIRGGDYAGAARIYRHLAETSTAPDYYRLMAADAELRAGNGVTAQALLGQVRARELVVDEQYRYTLLQSRLYLNQGRAREAMALLDTLRPQQLEPAAAAHYHTLRASAYNQLGNMLESARERVLLGYLLKSPQAMQKNNEAIYDDLNRMPEATLKGLAPPQPDTLGAWMELVGILREPADERSRQVQAWRERNPGHPADGPFLDGMLAKSDATTRVTPLSTPTPSAQPVVAESMPAVQAVAGSPFIGILLPLSGSFAPAGQAIRAGIEAAHDADTNPGKPTLKFVDTRDGNVSALYKHLVSEGATQVLGPLLKEDVASLAAGEELSVPVLALNQSNEVSHANLYQFGLTPEHEVEQSAGSAWFDGRQSALVLAPASAFGQRLSSHFNSYWKSLGGKIVATRTYRPGGNDFTTPVKELLAASPGASIPAEGAAAPLTPAENATGADFVFLIGDSRDARLIRPQLESQQAQPLPVYALSQVFAGRAESESMDRDLNGIIFCDVPWMLNTTDSGPLSRNGMQGLVERTPENYTRLIPMGIDAYNLVLQLSQLQVGSQGRYNGATGQLNLQPGNRIQRQLSCAQFESGVPHPRGIAPLLQPSAADVSGNP